MPEQLAQPSSSRAPQVPSAQQVLASFRGAPHAYLDVGHSRLAYWRFGQGPDLLFVHGWPLHAATFRALIPRLADRFTCHLVDLPGAGHSECTAASPIDLASHGATLARAVQKLALTRYALVAHDSGGAIARLLAAEDPNVVALAMSGTEVPGHHSPIVHRLQKTVALPFGVRAVMLGMRFRALRRSSLGFAACFQDLDHLDGEFHELFVAPMLRSHPRAERQFALVRNLDLSLIEGLARVHGKIRAPTLLIWGEHDPIFPVEKARAMAGQFAGRTSFEVLPRGKTFVHEEQPEAFAARARPFLERAFEQPAAPRA